MVRNRDQDLYQLIHLSDKSVEVMPKSGFISNYWAGIANINKSNQLWFIYKYQKVKSFDYKLRKWRTEKQCQYNH